MALGFERFIDEAVKPVTPPVQFLLQAIICLRSRGGALPAATRAVARGQSSGDQRVSGKCRHEFAAQHVETARKIEWYRELGNGNRPILVPSNS